MESIRIAAVVERAVAGELATNLELLVRWVRMAGQRGANVVLFPELNLSGYAPSRPGRISALPVPGSLSDDLQTIAEAERIAILAGVYEQGEKGERYASHLIVRPGRPLGLYRKLHIAPPEQALFSPGQTVPLFDHGGWRFGVQLCYDAHFPELSTAMALQGADALLMPHASPRGTPADKLRSWRRHLPARAFDNGVFVVACNQTGENGAGLHFPGVALALAPDGSEFGTFRGGRPGMMLVQLEREALDRVRCHRMRYFLPQRRPDMYPGTGYPQGSPQDRV